MIEELLIHGYDGTDPSEVVENRKKINEIIQVLNALMAAEGWDSRFCGKCGNVAVRQTICKPIDKNKNVCLVCGK